MIDKIIPILKRETKKYQLPLAQKIGKTKSPFKVLISTILSPRAKDTQTAKVCKELFKQASTPQKLIKIPNKKLQKILYSVGFYKIKSKRVKQASLHILKHHKGKVPDTLEELTKIPGVGRKVANIILAECFNKPAIAVDTHVMTVSNRLGLVKGRNPKKIELELQKIFPKKDWRIINRLLVIHGQNICVPVSPFCSKCKIRKYCPRIGVKKSR